MRVLSSWWTTGLVLVGIAGYIWQFTPFLKDPPVTILSMSASVEGDDLIVDVHMIKHRACGTEVARLLIDERGIVRQPWMPGNAQVPVGEHQRQQRLPLPADIKIGHRYGFRSLTEYTCIEGRWLVESPVAYFIVAEPIVVAP